jgi:uncharacterized peroxidase-related enzyme
MPLFPSLPDNASVPHVFERRPDIYAPFTRATQAIMRGPSPLTSGERELIGAYVSGLNSCRYCAGGHAAAAEQFGVAPGFLQALLDTPEAAPVSDKLKPILAYVRKLTLTSSRMTQADADAVYAAGWDERALSDAIAVCCMFNFMNRLVDGHGVKANPAVFGERGRRHKELGYIDQFPQLFEMEKAAAAAE